LLFRDQLHPDPASIATVAHKFLQGHTDFEIRWPKESSKLIQCAEELLADAENFYDRDSRFHGESSESTLSFMDLARSSLAYSRNVRERAIHRLVPMLEGMREYCGTRRVSPFVEIAVGNYLALANFEAQFGIAYALSHQRTQNFYPYSFWTSWFSLPNQLSRMNRLFEIDAELGRAKVIHLSGVEFVFGIFWGPLTQIKRSTALIDDAEAEERGLPNKGYPHMKLDDSWFVNQVLRQWNLIQSLKDERETIIYRPYGSLANIWDSSGKEIDERDDIFEHWGEIKDHT
jgi:hypothetical protein